MPTDANADAVKAVLNKINGKTLAIKGDWTKIVDGGPVSIWAATENGSELDLAPVVPGLKDFLGRLYASEYVDGRGTHECKGVNVSFTWRTADQPGIEDWTPPCKEP